MTSRFGGIIPHSDYLKKHFKSRNPVFDIPRRNEAVATDTIFSDTPAINDGSAMAQFFVGKETLVCDAYGMKSQINKLYDNIKSRGAMNTIITDDGKYEMTKKVADLLRSLLSSNMNQNHTTNTKNSAEQCYGDVKKIHQYPHDPYRSPAHCCLLCLLYVCSNLMSHQHLSLEVLLPFKP